MPTGFRAEAQALPYGAVHQFHCFASVRRDSSKPSAPGSAPACKTSPRASYMAAAAAAPAVPQSGITRSLPWRRCPEAERGRAQTPSPLPGSSPRSPATVSSASPDVPGRRHDAAESRRAELPQSPGQDPAGAPPTAADSRGTAAARQRPFPAPAERGEAR